MALILERTRSGFDAWYDKNKQRLSDKRRKLYAEDSEYRQRVFEAIKKRRSGEPILPTPPGAPISFAQAAERLDISISTLREWRRKKYFPEPKHHNRGLWFTGHQVLLLKRMKEFFSVYGKRPGNIKQERLKEVVASLVADWH